MQRLCFTSILMHPVLQLLAPSALRLMLISLSSNLRRPQGSDFWALPSLLWFESTLLGCVVSLDPTFCLSKFNLNHLSWSCGFSLKSIYIYILFAALFSHLAGFFSVWVCCAIAV